MRPAFSALSRTVGDLYLLEAHEQLLGAGQFVEFSEAPSPCWTHCSPVRGDPGEVCAFGVPFIPASRPSGAWVFEHTF